MWPFGKKQGIETIDKEIKCPRCSVLMHKLTQQNVTIDVCPHCRGLWLDQGELNKLLEIKHSIVSGGKREKTAKHKKKG